MASLFNPLITIISSSPCYLFNSHLQGNYAGSKESTLPYLKILVGLRVKQFHIFLQQRERLCSLWRLLWVLVLYPLALLLHYM